MTNLCSTINFPDGLQPWHKVFYIAGPMTGLPNYNREAFNDAEMYLRTKLAKDVVILNPARHPDGIKYEDYFKYAKIDIALSDVMILLDGWQNSKSVQYEMQIAQELDVKIIEMRNLRTP